MKNSEQIRLKKLAKEFNYDRGFDAQLLYYRYLEIKKYFKGNDVLELGCADGIMTKHLTSDFKEILAVDGSERYCKLVKQKIKHPGLTVVCSLFEDFIPHKKFHTIILGHILEHIDNPIALLRRVKKWLKPNGVLIIDVPNAHSLHRIAGVYMGGLKKVTDLNKRDLLIGHRRVYTWLSLKKEIKRSGLKLKKIDGVFLKTLTNGQIEKYWTKEMMDAYYKMGRLFPEYTAEIIAICTI